jgi:hypothetical protein
MHHRADLAVRALQRQHHAGHTEMLVQNHAGEPITFPFLVLSTDSGKNATATASVDQKILNGSQPVTVDEVDEVEAARLARERVANAGGDAALQEQARRWVQQALAKAERIRIGRTTIKPGESRRILTRISRRPWLDSALRWPSAMCAPRDFGELAAQPGPTHATLPRPWSRK